MKRRGRKMRDRREGIGARKGDNRKGKRKVKRREIREKKEKER